MILHKTFVAGFAVFFAVLVAGCADVMVMAGFQEQGPPVTNSEYFNTQMEKLLGKLMENKSRSFRKAAVLEFVNTNGKVSELGKMLTTKFGERSMAKNHFKVIPLGQVKEALSKLKIEFQGELKREQVKSIGDELGVDAVITGKIYDLQKGGDVDLTVNAIQPGSGDLLSAASVSIYRSKQVQALLEQF